MKQEEGIRENVRGRGKKVKQEDGRIRREFEKEVQKMEAEGRIRRRNKTERTKKR